MQNTKFHLSAFVRLSQAVESIPLKLKSLQANDNIKYLGFYL